MFIEVYTTVRVVVCVCWKCKQLLVWNVYTTIRAVVCVNWK